MPDEQSPDLSRLLDAIAASGEEVAAWQAAMTACAAIGPEAGGPGETEKCRLIQDWLSQWGATGFLRADSPDARVPAGCRPNLILILPGQSEQRLWLFGHMDVVPAGDASAWSGDPFCLRRQGDLLFGRGVEDNQQAIASMLALARALLTRGVRPARSLGLVFMADEENGSAHGLAHILERLPELFRPEDLYIVPDAGSPRGDLMEIAEKGQLWLRLTVTGRQCHASTPGHGANAFVAAADLALRCRARLSEIFAERNELFRPDHSTFEPTRHEGNHVAVNIVPGRDVFYMDCRLLPGHSPGQALAEARVCASEVEELHGVKVDIEPVQEQPANAMPADSPVLAGLARAIASVYGVKARACGIGGATVAAFLRRRGLPAVVWSRLAGSCHQPDERSSIESTLKDAMVFARVLMSQEAGGV